MALKKFVIPKRENEDAIRELEDGKREEVEIQTIIKNSFIVSKNCLDGVKKEKVEVLGNKALDRKYVDKKNELKEANVRLGESYAFLVMPAFKIKHVLKDGVRVGNFPRSVLGERSKGIHLYRYADLCLSEAKFNAKKYSSNSEICLVVFKVLLGRSNLVSVTDSENLIDPSPLHESHVSDKRPTPYEKSFFAKKNKSLVYLYEYDMTTCKLVDYPRGIFPYALIHYILDNEKLISPISVVNNYQKKVTKEREESLNPSASPENTIVPLTETNQFNDKNRLHAPFMSSTNPSQTRETPNQPLFSLMKSQHFEQNPNPMSQFQQNTYISQVSKNRSIFKEINTVSPEQPPDQISLASKNLPNYENILVTSHHLSHHFNLKNSINLKNINSASTLQQQHTNIFQNANGNVHTKSDNLHPISPQPNHISQPVTKTPFQSEQDVPNILKKSPSFTLQEAQLPHLLETSCQNFVHNVGLGNKVDFYQLLFSFSIKHLSIILENTPNKQKQKSITDTLSILAETLACLSSENGNETFVIKSQLNGILVKLVRDFLNGEKSSEKKEEDDEEEEEIEKIPFSPVNSDDNESSNEIIEVTAKPAKKKLPDPRIKKNGVKTPVCKVKVVKATSANKAKEEELSATIRKTIDATLKRENVKKQKKEASANVESEKCLSRAKTTSSVDHTKVNFNGKPLITSNVSTPIIPVKGQFAYLKGVKISLLQDPRPNICKRDSESPVMELTVVEYFPDEFRNIRKAEDSKDSDDTIRVLYDQVVESNNKKLRLVSEDMSSKVADSSEDVLIIT